VTELFALFQYFFAAFALKGAMPAERQTALHREGAKGAKILRVLRVLAVNSIRKRYARGCACL
jgi:hypothetical protein